MFLTLSKLYKLVSEYSIYKLYFYIFIIIISTFVEGLSIGIIFPVLDTLVNSNEKNLFFTFFNFSEIGSKNFFIEIIFLFLFIFISRSIFLTFISWWRSGYVKELNIYFRSKLFNSYIQNDYSFFILNKPSLLMRNSHQEIINLMSSIEAMLRLIAELFVFLAIIFVLIYFEPRGSIMGILIFLVFGIAYIAFFKSSLKSWSNLLLFYNGKIIQLIQQSFETIKYIKVSNMENKIKNLYKSSLGEYVKYHRLRNFMSDIPRIYLELLGVVVILFIIYNLYDPQKSDLSYLVPSLALVMAGAFRLLPNIGRIISYIQQMYGVNASIELIQKDLYKHRPDKKDLNEKKLNFQNKIELKNINYTYPKEKKKVLNKFNLTIPKNNFICITGESGIGKTTIIDIIAAILEPKSGHVLVDGKKINKSNKNLWQKNIGYVSQSTILFDGSIKENIALSESGESINIERVNNAINLSNLRKFIQSKKNSLEYIINERGINLSGGQIQRLGIARSLYYDPDLLIFDEFTSALDKENEAYILKSLELLKKKKTIIAISHNNNVIKKADKVIYLVKGKNGEIRISKF